ncbi:MAG TPA: methionyl-tRNA formyltransferase [Planctomycetota bacterium]|nr:methionyl-tRNA formyltransferase [Planctomycetota bacterium]
MKIIFLGTGAFGVPSLQALVAAGLPPLLVVSQPDRQKGRSLVKAPSPLAEAAQDMGLPLFQPERINRPDSLDRLAPLEPDVLVVISYGQILKKPLLALPKWGAVNLHGSLLPRHRGASPIQASILAGDEVTGVTTMLMDEGLDSGPVLKSVSTPLGSDETSAALHDRLAVLGASLLVPTLKELAAGTIKGIPQDPARVTTCGLIKKHDGHLDFRRLAVQIERAIRAFFPWPGAQCEIPVRDNWIRATLTKATVVSAPRAEPGSIHDPSAGTLTVACGEGALRIHQLKPSGKREMTDREFLRGYPVASGSRMRAPQ